MRPGVKPTGATAFERAQTKTRGGVTAAVPDPFRGTSIKEEPPRAECVETAGRAADGGSSARNHARQPERGQRQRRWFGNRGEAKAKADVTLIAFEWHLEADRRESRRQQRGEAVIRWEG